MKKQTLIQKVESRLKDDGYSRGEIVNLDLHNRSFGALYNYWEFRMPFDWSKVDITEVTDDE